MSRQVRPTQQAKDYLLGDANARKLVEMLPGGRALIEEFEREAEAARFQFKLDDEHGQMAGVVATYITQKLAEANAIPRGQINNFEGALKGLVFKHIQEQASEIEVMLRDEDPALTGSASPSIRCSTNQYAEADLFMMPYGGVKPDALAMMADSFGIQNKDVQHAFGKTYTAIIIQPYTKKISMQVGGNQYEIDWRNRKVDGLQLNF